MSTFFFKNIDRSESTELFIQNKINKLQIDIADSKWIISKQKKEFTVKCIIHNQKFEKSDYQIYQAITDIIDNIKKSHFHHKAS